MNREEAREKALDIAKERELIGVVSPELAWNIGFSSGFDAGQANQWVRIESEADLPKEAGDYWVTCLYKSKPIVSRIVFAPNSEFELFPSNAIAWLKIQKPEPYQENNTRYPLKEEVKP
jgi:hypothetical protein